MVVFTDGESQPVSTLATDFAAEPRIDVTSVRMGDASERIWESGVAEAGYTPEAGAGETLTAAAAAAVDGRVLEEGDMSRGRRRALGARDGPTTPRCIEGNRQALMPYVALLTIIPLGFVAVPAESLRAAKVQAPRGVAQPG